MCTISDEAKNHATLFYIIHMPSLCHSFIVGNSAMCVFAAP